MRLHTTIMGEQIKIKTFRKA
ncbi:uncharacterized protein Dvir_GJ26698 [Drosophila virilis]|uniref:Uncharacterized protein n=1 Tax=Drosophila virilis TaxID=7244 RepID=A0A0Q9W8M8_DROVI|nr:uncharacterized protein Dvir_GJ26698 [Drosophila virilis]